MARFGHDGPLWASRDRFLSILDVSRARFGGDEWGSWAFGGGFWRILEVSMARSGGEGALGLPGIDFKAFLTSPGSDFAVMGTWAARD